MPISAAQVPRPNENSLKSNLSSDAENTSDFFPLTNVLMMQRFTQDTVPNIELGSAADCKALSHNNESIRMNSTHQIKQSKTTGD